MNLLIVVFVVLDPSLPSSVLQLSDSSFFRFSLNINDTDELQDSIGAADEDVFFHYINTLVSYSYENHHIIIIIRNKIINI